MNKCTLGRVGPREQVHGTVIWSMRGKRNSARLAKNMFERDQEVYLTTGLRHGVTAVCRHEVKHEELPLVIMFLA